MYLFDLLHGLGITLILMLASVGIGFSLALIMAIVSTIAYLPFRKLVDAFIFVIRGTPLLVQLFLIYFGLGQFEWLKTSFLWPIFKEPMACAIIALALNTACYTCVLFKGAMQSVPHNEVLACQALGMSPLLSLGRVILPQALRMAMPAYSNEVMIVLKSTSLASTITLLDVMGVTQKLISQTYETVTFYLIAGAIYLAINACVMLLFKYFSSTNMQANR